MKSEEKIRDRLKSEITQKKEFKEFGSMEGIMMQGIKIDLLKWILK